jgi:hypothetical protein
MAAHSSKSNQQKPVSKRKYCSLPKQESLQLDHLNDDRAKLILQNASKWANGTTLYYYFFDKKTDGAWVKKKNGTKEWKPWKGSQNQMNTVRKAFRMWKSIGIGLSFEEVYKREAADIRIAFMEDDGSWPYVGRDIRRKRKDPRTMNFGWNIATKDRHNGIDTALHEIGHTLGFPHEHQNPFAGIVWNKKAVYESLGGEPNCWTKEETDSNILDKISPEEVNGSKWDRNSIMHYPFDKGLILQPKQYQTRDLEPKGGLSNRDVHYALKFYPSKNPVPDILITGGNSYEINAGNSAQQNYLFKPATSKKYTIKTAGQFDTVVVLSEKLRAGSLRFVAGNDNAGTAKNAQVTTMLSKNKTYVIKVKIYYRPPGEKAFLKIS